MMNNSMTTLNENLLRALVCDLRETGAVTKEILSWTGEIYTHSWKFPNLRGDIIEPIELLKEFSGKFQDKYMFTLELIIDRLNFFLRVFVTFLESFPTTYGTFHMPPNMSCPPFMSLGALIHITWKRAESIYYTLLERVENDLKKEMTGKSDSISKMISPSSFHKNTQTLLFALECCENCEISMGIMKKIMESMEKIFSKTNGVNESESNKILPESSTAKFKVKMEKELNKTTQWGAVSLLEEAIREDLGAVEDGIAHCLSKLVKYEKEKEENDAKVSKLESEKKKLLKKLENVKTNENKLNHRTTELESLLSEKNKEIKSISEQFEELKSSYDNLKQENQEITEKLSKIKVELETAGEELEMKSNEVFIYKQKYKAEMMNRKQTQEEAQVVRITVEDLEEQLLLARSNTAAIAEDWETEREKFLAEMEDLQRNLIAMEGENVSLANMVHIVKQELEDKINEINKLNETLKEKHQDELLLIKYPDLQGPVEPELIGIPDVDMQNQIKANKIRIKLLHDENSVLENTIEKLKKNCLETKM